MFKERIENMRILIRNGQVVDPSSKTEGRFDVLVEGDRIVRVAEQIDETADRVLDAEGCYVMPGFIDLHVHLRDPDWNIKRPFRRVEWLR